MPATDVISWKLAIKGGPPAIDAPDESLFHWPIVTEEDEQAVIKVLRKGNMSSTVSYTNRQTPAQFAAGGFVGGTTPWGASATQSLQDRK